MALGELDIKITFQGTGVDEKGYMTACRNMDYLIPAGREIVAVDSAYFPSTEVDLLLATLLSN